jgi:hypothetical protein
VAARFQPSSALWATRVRLPTGFIITGALIGLGGLLAPLLRLPELVKDAK